MSDTKSVISAASRRTGYRPMLVGPVVELIRKWRDEGRSEAWMTSRLRAELGPDNAAAERPFVSWVIGQLGK
ncbi:hypothetical protein CFN78_28145 [Amycolatopsis antarctica]|uniref:Uncharacterized protein n=1 Tax=Amycolatopsis antarctica TaxID=1854586 RepID=A0A263CWT5_9PSEU|nr:hypothetical protein [Amycolatopsis antarctica]OZM69897.1 hypothetical protein CFN78_28145 [Amycolatopsis antarctica]